MNQYLKNKLVLFGGVGTLIAGLCCFTPLLVWGVVAVGAGAAVAYLDWVLLPLLFLFGAMLLYGLDQVKKNKVSGACCEGEDHCDVRPSK